MDYHYICYDCGRNVDPDQADGVPFVKRAGARGEVPLCENCWQASRKAKRSHWRNISKATHRADGAAAPPQDRDDDPQAEA